MAIKSSVSLYSLQYQYLTGKMDLEAILKYMKDLDVDGIELLPDQMIQEHRNHRRKHLQNGTN